LRQHLTKLGLGKIEPLAWHWVRDWVRHWLRYWRNHHRLGSWHVAALQAQPIYFATYRADQHHAHYRTVIAISTILTFTLCVYPNIDEAQVHFAEQC
jgi:hypothetical protein